MTTVDTDTSAHKEVVHTERHAPIEVVFGRVVYYILGVIEVVLGLRFVLRMLGANTAAGFVQFVYGLAGVLIAPFTAMFRSTVAGSSRLEWSVLVAMVVYALIAWGIVSLMRALNPRRSSETVELVERSEDTTARQ